MGLSKGEALLDAGYSEATAIKPSQVLESKGFKEALDEYGLTEGLVVNALVEDIKLKPQNRKPELELAAKIRRMIGTDEPASHVPVNILINFGS